jgi:C4-dicarboxylate-specific signal transduction histidine kinase
VITVALISVASLAAALFVAVLLWRRLSVLRDEVRRLVTSGILSNEIRGPRILREIHRDLKELADKSGVNVGVAVRSNGREAIISVHDDGPGVPLSDQPHLFERFYRVHKDRSRDAGGSGLGLSIVKHTIQAHGGTVAVQSSPGAGATFVISLPFRQM